MYLYYLFFFFLFGFFDLPNRTTSKTPFQTPAVTADGIKASLDHLSEHIPMLVLETALPTKFEKSVIEAIGKKPIRPEGLKNLEEIDQKFEVFENKTSLVKDFILAKK